jgi:hypothetical protein
MWLLERPRVSTSRPNAVIGLSPRTKSVQIHSLISDDTPLTIRFDGCAILDRMLAGDCNA